jgi:hypothetical protein
LLVQSWVTFSLLNESISSSPIVDSGKSAKTAYLFETEIGRRECSSSELTDSFIPPEYLDAILDQAVGKADSSQSPFPMMAS